MLTRLAVAVVAAVLAAGPLSVVVEYGVIRTAPAYIRLRVRVEPDQANRFLRVGIADPFGHETSSHEDLPGERARPTRWVEFKDVPAGEYVAWAYVDRGTEEEWYTTATFTVIGGGL